jgi:hypothetical protein
MALKLIEGFDAVQASKLPSKNWTSTGASRAGEVTTVTLTTGRINGSAHRHSTSGAGSGGFSGAGTLKKALPAAYSTLVDGFAFRLNGLPPSETEVFNLLSGATQTVRVFVTSAGAVRIKNSGGTTIATGASGLVVANGWVYIELKAVINGASGSITTQANGAADIALTTGNFGSSNLDGIQSYYVPVAGSYFPTFDFDDFYVLDTSGTDNTTFLGDVHVETIFPAADGANTSWTPDSGSPHFSRVNEKTSTFPDDDTSYIYSSTAGQRDSYDMDTLAILSGSIFGVQVGMYARKDDAATRQIASVVRQGGTNYDGATQTLSTSYVDYTEILENDPSDGADWTVAKVNSAEFGVKLVT